MTYASLEDLVERAGEVEILQVADRDGDGIADPALVHAALVHADNVVNGYVASVTSLPLATVPDLVRTWATAIARYFLHREGPPEYVTADYKDAITGLKDVSAGRIKLPLPDGALAAPLSGTHDGISPAEVFTDQALRGWR